MPKIALNFICKNEHHIIERMLESAKPIIDLIVAVDTGSDDNTIDIIKDFGHTYGIATHVFQRPFDNFGNSRNFALNKLQEVVRELHWNAADTWGCFIDCDEMLQISSYFHKDDLIKDIYVTIVQGSGQSFTRQLLFHLSAKIWWEGPIHEVLQWEEATVSIALSEGLGVLCESVGASWKGDLEAKFVNYAKLLVEYIEKGNSSFRWCYYTGNSYTCAAEHSKSTSRKLEWTKLAMEYYQKAESIGAPTIDEQIILQRQMAESRELADQKWSITQELFLNSYAIDPRRAESVASIITHYISERRWELAQVFSDFALKTFHGRDPFGQGVAESEGPLYQWKLLLYHFVSCFYSGRKKQAGLMRRTLRELGRKSNGILNYKDLVYMQYNSPLYLSIRAINPFAKKKFSI